MTAIQPLVKVSTAMTPLALRSDLGAGRGPGGQQGQQLALHLQKPVERSPTPMCDDRLLVRHLLSCCPSVAALTVSRFLPSLMKAGFSPDVTGPISKVAERVRTQDPGSGVQRRVRSLRRTNLQYRGRGVSEEDPPPAVVEDGTSEGWYGEVTGWCRSVPWCARGRL